MTDNNELRGRYYKDYQIDGWPIIDRDNKLDMTKEQIVEQLNKYESEIDALKAANEQMQAQLSGIPIMAIREAVKKLRATDFSNQSEDWKAGHLAAAEWIDVDNEFNGIDWTFEYMEVMRHIESQAVEKFKAKLLESWDGLPRDLIMWLDMNDRPTQGSLIEHCRRVGTKLPESITSEFDSPRCDNSVPSKGSRAVWILKAFIHEAENEDE